MRIAIIYNGADVMGGMETLMLRCSRYLKLQGHEVTCIIKNVDPIRGLVSDIEVVEAGDLFDRLLNPLILARFLAQHHIGGLRIVLALDQGSAIIAPLIARMNASSGCVAFASNWVPRYFWFQDHAPWHPMSLILNWNFRINYGPETILFMMRQYIEQGRRIFGPEWSATLFPVPVDLTRFDAVSRKPAKGRIVSVGRLAQMKEYNLYMIDVVDQLLKRGHEVRWDVYGDGALEKEMHERILAKGLSDYIRLHGSIAYDRYPSVLSEAFVFVGMGTAVLEAAAAGVPPIVALAYDSSGVTHGSLRCLPYGNLGEIEPDLPLVPVVSELERILNLSPRQYELESQSVKAAAKPYDEDAVMQILVDPLRRNPVRRIAFMLYVVVVTTYELCRYTAGRWRQLRQGGMPKTVS